MARDAGSEIGKWWHRVYRDPYTVLLVVAAVVQVMLADSAAHIARPQWAAVALASYVLSCALAIAGRVRGHRTVALAAPFLLFVATAAWRLADAQSVSGFGALALVAVVWIAFYGTRGELLLALVAVAAAMLLPSLAATGAIDGPDLRHALTTLALSAFIGPALHAMVTQHDVEAARVSALEPVGSELDAMMRAASGHLIIRTTPDGTVVGFNVGAERILGWTADEVIGRMTMLDFHDPDETPALAARLGVEPNAAALLATTLKREGEVRDYRCRTKDNRRIVVELSISSVTDPAGELDGFVGIGTDVTAARRATQWLAAQREIYRVLVDNLPSTTVALWDEELRCVTIGGHWLAKIDTDPAQFSGRPIESFFHERDRKQGRRAWERARTEPVLVEMDLSDGRTYEFSALPVHGPDNQNLVLSVSRDVTERRAAERERSQILAALSMSEASFRQAFEAAPIGIALTSVHGPWERFERVNPAFAEILGRTPDELIGCAVDEVTHPDDIGADPDVPAGESGTLRKRFIRASGRPVWVELSYTVVRDADGKPSFVIKQAQDIDAIKESERALLDALEQQRAATASLRELDRIRTELVGTISHELRTPLTSVQGYLELLGSEPLTASQHGMVGVAVRNADRLSNLVDNLLVLVRLDADDSMGTFASTDVVISRIVTGATETIRPTVVAKSQQLDLDLGANKGCVVHGDAEQLDRVLVNLLSNASKYTPSGGSIAVRLEADARTVRIVVSDTGIGVPPDEQDYLFTRFFRASTARQHAIGGNGLGLAIVKSIIERHDGSVSVTSAPGAGSQFTVELPLVRQSVGLAS